MNNAHSKMSSKAGFSLLQMSILLVIGGLVLAATLPGGDAAGTMAKTRITMDRMARVEDATRGFMKANLRRPYPADLTVNFTSQYYGLEITPNVNLSVIPTNIFTTPSRQLTFTPSGGVLTSGNTATIGKGWGVSGADIPDNTWLQSITSATDAEMSQAATGATISGKYFRAPMIAGGVPTKTLGLPDEYGIDGFGRRMIYVVDQRVTRTTDCSTLQDSNMQGAVALSSSDNFLFTTYDSVMWALMSYGADGQGAVGIQGSALNNRIKTGNVGDASTLNNAFYDASEVTTFTGAGLVNKPATSTFDDIVWTNPRTKNICKYGTAAEEEPDESDFGMSSSLGTMSTTYLADINGDNYLDVVLGTTYGMDVIFGKADGWPAFTNYTTYTPDGVNGFRVTRSDGNTTFNIWKVKSGDVNGDGYNDLVFGLFYQWPDTGYEKIGVIFGRATWSSTYDISTMLASEGVLFNTPNTYYKNPGSLSFDVADVNGDGYDDIGLPVIKNTSPQYMRYSIIYGRAAGTWSSDELSDAYLSGSDGKYFTAEYPSSENDGMTVFTESYESPQSAICNLNGDAYKDIVIPGASSFNMYHTGRIYIEFGADPTAFAALNTNPATSGIMLRFNTTLATTGTHSLSSITCADVDNDGLDDILVFMLPWDEDVDGNKLYVIKGRSAGSWPAAGSSINMDSSSNYDMLFNFLTNRPTWFNPSFAATMRSSMVVGDVNADGKSDIVLSVPSASPYVSAGASFTINSTNTGTQRWNQGITYVLFQPSGGWGASPVTKDFFDNYSFNGTDGFKISGNGMYANITRIVDFDKDGKNDLVYGGYTTAGGIIFGRTTWPESYDASCLVDTSPTYCHDMIAKQPE